MVLDINMVPETIFSHIKTDKVKFHEENGTILLTPVTEKKTDFDVLFGMFSDGKLSVDEFIKEKQVEKELEG
jgi:hypothetical protein